MHTGRAAPFHPAAPTPSRLAITPSLPLVQHSRSGTVFIDRAMSSSQTVDRMQRNTTQRVIAHLDVSKLKWARSALPTL
eukprot:3357269-Rhodomonas_salina.1